MELIDIACLCAFSVLFLALNTLAVLIRRYIVNKPPSTQSLYDMATGPIIIASCF